VVKGEVCEKGAPAPEIQTDLRGYFTLDFNPFDIEPGKDVAAWYIQPDGNCVGAVFRGSPSPGPIQAAINAGGGRRHSLHPPGVYTETISFNGKNITLRSEDPEDVAVVQATVIDGGRAGSVVTFDGGEINAAVPSGFTIRNGLSRFGAGIRILGASPTITNNIIDRNGGKAGGAVYVEGNAASPIIRGNRITDNIATEWGGGMAIRAGASPLVENNVVTGNLALDGSGITIAREASPVVENNTITDNWAGVDMHFPLHAQQHLDGVDLREPLDATPTPGGGIAIIGDSSPIVEHNTIRRNRGRLLGGGMLVAQNSSPHVLANCIAENSAEWGAGIRIFGHSSPLIKGNTVLSNTAEFGAGGLYVWDNANPFLADNVIEGNLSHQGGAALWVDRTSSVLDEDGVPLDPASVFTLLEETDS